MEVDTKKVPVVYSELKNNLPSRGDYSPLKKAAGINFDGLWAAFFFCNSKKKTTKGVFLLR